MPVSDEVFPQDLQHPHFPQPVVHRVVGPQVPMSSNPSFAYVFKDFGLVKYFVVAFVVVLWSIFVVLETEFGLGQLGNVLV